MKTEIILYCRKWKACNSKTNKVLLLRMNKSFMITWPKKCLREPMAQFLKSKLSVGMLFLLVMSQDLHHMRATVSARISRCQRKYHLSLWTSVAKTLINTLTQELGSTISKKWETIGLFSSVSKSLENTSIVRRQLLPTGITKIVNCSWKSQNNFSHHTTNQLMKQNKLLHLLESLVWFVNPNCQRSEPILVV